MTYNAGLVRARRIAAKLYERYGVVHRPRTQNDRIRESWVEGEVVVAIIMQEVAACFGLLQSNVYGTCRARPVARPRLLSYLLARRLSGLSWPQLGAAFKRDHTTVLDGCRAAERLLRDDAAMAKNYTAVEAAVLRRLGRNATAMAF